MSVVDLCFRLDGDTIPADHSYRLFSALSHVAPVLHGDEQIGIHAIAGNLVGNRMLALSSASRLTVRLPAERIPDMLPLAGKAINLSGSRLTIGVPEVRTIDPAPRLYSRLVVIKGSLDPSEFMAAATRQLHALGVIGQPSFVEQGHIAEANRDRPGGSRSPVLRRTLQIRDKNIVGFALHVVDLNPAGSLCLQEKGLGGRRRFGCGLFIADRRG